MKVFGIRFVLVSNNVTTTTTTTTVVFTAICIQKGNITVQYNHHKNFYCGNHHNINNIPEQFDRLFF